MARQSAALRKNNPQRMMGLGQAPTVPNLQACLGSKFDSIQVVESVKYTIQVPVSDANIGLTFGDTINLLVSTNTLAGAAFVDSTMITNGVLQTDFFICGFGVHITVEPFVFSQIGNSVSPLAGGAIPPSPDVFSLNDVVNGALGPQFGAGGVAGASTMTPAILEWGGATWRAAWHLANGYRFVWTVNQRLNVVDELLNDIIYCGCPSAGAGGDSDAPVAPFAQRTNEVYGSLCGACQVAGVAFWPVTHRRVGSQGATFPAAGGPNVGDFHPTRDFDLAAQTWGRPDLGANMPFRKLSRCCLMERGVPIIMQLEGTNPLHQAYFQSEISASGSPFFGNGTIPELASPIGGAGGYTQNTLPVMTEQTLDTAPGLVSQQVQVGRAIYKGGLLEIETLLKGYEVMRDWCAFLNGCDAAGNLYLTTGGGGSMLYNAQVGATLAGR